MSERILAKKILKAIAESRYHVVILSKRYADSKWCLKELAAMVVHMTESADMSSQHKKVIIPVFYDVEPSDVRHQRNDFEEAFKKHEVCNPADVEEWRQAMTKVGELQGLVINGSNKKEAEVIQEIVERVAGCRDNVILPVAKQPVGINSRVVEVMELLCIEEGGVKMVGIYGMGGVGKTTLAKEIHNRLQGRFDKAIYIEGIKNKKDRLTKLQEEFISKAFKEGNKKIRNPSEGVAEIKRRFPGKRIFAVLDDVDDGDQLEALAGGREWFGEGTRILITTRDEHLLDAHEQLLDAHRHVAKKYQVHELNSTESLYLFSRRAFNKDQPSEEFMEISKKIVKAAGGLPLALEVLGGSLSPETPEEVWEEVETKLKNSKYSKIDNCLRISYDGLNKDEKEGFLDIACFFLGQKKDEVIDIWKGCNFDAPVSTMNSLLHKCLVKVDNIWGNLYMHDLLRHMGRVMSSSSRLWDQKKVWEVLDEHKGTDEIKGIICEGYPEGKGERFDAFQSWILPERERASVDVEAFANMSNLQLLILKNINLKGDFSRMPGSLRSLDWTGCSMKTLPDDFNIQKLGCLMLRKSNIVQLWSDSCISKVLTNLKVVDLWGCGALKKLPDLSHSLDLEKLNLRNCFSLTDIPESIEKLTGLKRLTLESCTSLSALPESIGNLIELRRLDLSGCKSLSALPSSIGRLTLLEDLHLHHCTSLSTLPDSIGNLTELRRLNLSDCRSLSALPSSIERLTLLELNLTECTSLSTLSDSIGNLTKLRRLDLWLCISLSALPSSIGRLTLLEELRLRECTSLSTLPDSIGDLTELRRLDLSDCYSLSALPSSIERLTLLEELLLHSCTSLSTLPDSIGNLTELRRLDLSCCEFLSALPSSIGRLTLFEELKLRECTSLSTLPDSIGDLTELRRLNLSFCKSLSALPHSIGMLTLLEELKLRSCTSLSTLPDSIGNLTELRRLYLSKCESLSALPDSIGNLTLLEELKLIFCTSLSTLPSSIGNMRRLSTLVLGESGIRELPDSVRLLESLEWLGIKRCRLRSRLPLWEMKCLKGLLIGGEVNQKDESEVYEIPYGITHYSRHTQECRRIRYIEDLYNYPHDEPCKVFELSIWVVSGRERRIILLVYPSRKRHEERKYWNGPWLKHIFPDDFTPVDDREALDAYASTSPAPDISKEQLRDFYDRMEILRKGY